MTTSDKDSLKPSISDRIVVVGAHTILGRLLIKKLEKNPEVENYWVIDLHAPKKKSKKLHFVKVDLIKPGADATLAAKLMEIGANVLVHCASKNNPTLNWVYAHELEVIGTLNLVSAAKAANIRKFVFCSSTAVYGASPKNPNYIKETQRLDPHPHSHLVRDKVDAEKEVSVLFDEKPEMIVCVLRFCLIVGPTAKNYFTELFRRTVVPTLLGYDPLMQFLHESDASRALWNAVRKDYPGIFNIVGKGVIPLSYALREAGCFFRRLSVGASALESSTWRGSRKTFGLFPIFMGSGRGKSKRDHEFRTETQFQRSLFRICKSTSTSGVSMGELKDKTSEAAKTYSFSSHRLLSQLAKELDEYYRDPATYDRRKLEKLARECFHSLKEFLG